MRAERPRPRPPARSLPVVATQLSFASLALHLSALGKAPVQRPGAASSDACGGFKAWVGAAHPWPPFDRRE